MGLTFGTGNRLEKTSAVVAALPLSFAGWINGASFSSNPRVFSVEDATDSNYLEGFMSFSFLAAAASSGVGSTQAQTTAAITASVWQHVAMVFASTTSRTVYVNGGNAVTDVTSSVPATLTISSIGGSGPASARTNPLIASLAFIAFWSVALTAADVLSLSLGAGPKKVRPDKLVSYPRLLGLSPDPDAVSSTAWTLVGSLPSVANPPIFAP